MRLALVQFNPVVGDLPGNGRRALERVREASAAGADLVVFPELALCGYPPKDLLLQEGFCERARDEARLFAAEVSGPVVMLGAPWRSRSGAAGSDRHADGPITNSMLVIRAGAIESRYDKRLLPTYDVFDEDRYFTPGDCALVVDVAGVRIGVSICEDLWRGSDAGVSDRYAGHRDPVRELVDAGAQLIVNPSASPFVLGKGGRQRDILTRHARVHGVALAAVNQVGGNDDLIFDGHSAVYVPAPNGARLVAAGPGFTESILYADLGPDRAAWEKLPEVADPLLTSSEESLLWRALVLGVRDYCRKTGFTSCLLGLSGGIDSALTACLASAALGPANVLGVGLPSRYSSRGAVSDAQELSQRLGIRWSLVPIDQPHTTFEALLAPLFQTLAPGKGEDATEENVQSRIRGVILMAISNKTGAILLTTGNKSEVAVGYCTLYGDMNGGLAVLSDVTKEDVYRLSRWLNTNWREAGLACADPRGPIPEDSITKAPSAELRPDQKDQDTLPPYEQLDRIIEGYIEERRSTGAIARETGIDEALVRKITRLIDLSEYKRKQMATGLKVTSATFGPGRRWPIAQGYRDRATDSRLL